MPSAPVAIKSADVGEAMQAVEHGISEIEETTVTMPSSPVVVTTADV